MSTTEEKMSNFNSSIRGGAVAAALLAGVAVAQPANDLCSGAERIPVVNAGTTYTSSTTTNIASAAAAVEAPGFSCFTSSVKNSIWYVFTAPAAGNYRIETCDVSNYDTIIQVYSGSSCGALTTLGSTGCNDQGGCTPANASALNLNLGAGEYYVQVASWSSGTVTATSSTALSIRYTALPGIAVADTCSSTVPNLAVNSPVVFSTYLGLNDDSRVGGPASGAGSCYVGLGHGTTAADNASPGRDVVFNFTPASTASYNIRLGAPSVTNNATLYLTDSCVAATTPPQLYSPPQCIAAANRVGGTVVSQEELVCIPLTTGVPYFVLADETALGAGATYELEVTECLPEAEANSASLWALGLGRPGIVSTRSWCGGRASTTSFGTATSMFRPWRARGRRAAAPPHPPCARR